MLIEKNKILSFFVTRGSLVDSLENYMGFLKTSFAIGIFFILLIIADISCESTNYAKSDMEIKSDSILTSFAEELEIKRGYQVYRDYGCILCHGVNGEGLVKNRNAQTAEEIPSLTYVAEGFTVGEFHQKVLKGVKKVARLEPSGDDPPLVMPGWKNMSKSELADLTLYVWKLYPEEEEDEW